MEAFRLFRLSSLFLLFSLATCQTGRDLDQFTYASQGSSNPNNVFPPQQWNNVQCPNLGECLGWPEKFEARVGWNFNGNSCLWCPASGNSCGSHHSSPINARRQVSIQGDPLYNACIDTHSITYYDSSCTFSELVRLDAFSIERHALRIAQPIEEYATNQYRIACVNNGQRYFGRVDYPKGFSQWFHLASTSIQVPSEHFQNDRQYAGEIHLNMFYSVSGSSVGVDNEMGTIAVFLQEDNSVSEYPLLNRLICQWRKVEEDTRKACGLGSVSSAYSGCTIYNTPSTRKLRGKAKTAIDVLWGSPSVANETYQPKTVQFYDEDYNLTRWDEDEWQNFITQLVQEEEDVKQEHRRLIDYSEAPYTTYFPMIGCRSEYFFRYSGTQTVPPCYGTLKDALKTLKQRGKTNHWRLMKDPIRVSSRQILELHRLIKERIAPADSPVRACRPDTAAKNDPNDSRKISVARPLQSTHKVHYTVFCECQWRSKFTEEQQWCQLDRNTRLFQQPYNYPSTRF